MHITPDQLRATPVPFLDTLGIEYLTHDEGRASFQLTIAEKHLRTLGLLHGGVTCSLMDTTMGLAAMTLAQEGKVLVTSQMNLHFVRPCKLGETILATASVKHGGRQTVVVEGEIRTADGELVAVATGTYMYTSG